MKKSIKYYTLLEAQAQVDLESDHDNIEEDMEHDNNYKSKKCPTSLEPQVQVDLELDEIIQI